MIIFACEDVIQISCEDLEEICNGDSLNLPACDTCDTNYNPLEDSIPKPPIDTIPIPPEDTIDNPGTDDNCVSYEGLWICGIDDPNEFDYDLLPGSWNLIRQTIHPNSGSQIDEYFGDSIVCSLTLTLDYSYTEILDGEIISEGTWEVYPELNNQLWLTSTDDEIFKYYIITLELIGDEDAFHLNMVRLNYELPAIIEKDYEK